MTRPVTDEAERWRERYEELLFRQQELQSQLQRTEAQLEEAVGWRNRYEPALRSRSWHIVETMHLWKWQITQRLARPAPQHPSGSPAAAPPASNRRLEDGWDWEAEGARHLSMGRHTYFRPNVIVFPGDTGNVIVGNFSSIFYDVDIFAGGNHTSHTVSTFAFRQVFDIPGRYMDGIPSTKGHVRIGSDVWIGKGAMILSGVTIGDGAIVGARSVVSKDIRPYAIAVGNPAREVKRRFSDEIVDALLAIRWWDWPDDVVKARIDELSGGQVTDFLAKYGLSGSDLDGR